MINAIRVVIMFILMASFLIATKCKADEWTRADVERQAIYTVLHVIDWRQTMNIAKNPSRYAEGGVVAHAVIGDHPSMAQVNAYMLGSAILSAVVVDQLPSKWRPVFQIGLIVDAGYSVRNNYLLGLSGKF